MERVFCSIVKLLNIKIKMNTNCALCGIPLTSMDTVLGENKLSDGGILCNKCLNKATGINKDLVYNLINYNLAEVRDIILGESIVEEEEEVEAQPVVKESISRTMVTFSHSFQLNVNSRKEPTRLDEIKEQIIALNIPLSISVNTEVNELANVLDNNEKLIAVAEGKYLNNNLEGILVSTERRVIFIDKNLLGSISEGEFSHDKIVSVQHSYGLISSELKLFTRDGVKAEFKLYNRNASKNFYESIQGSINRPRSSSGERPQSNQTAEGISKKDETIAIFEKLEKLGKLKETGILTNEEFEEQKKKLLGKL